MSKFHLRNIIEVTWVDSNGTSKWDSLENYRNHSVAHYKTVGYLLKKTKKEVLVVFSQSPANNGDGNGAMAIPMGCVTKIKRIK